MDLGSPFYLMVLTAHAVCSKIFFSWVVPEVFSIAKTHFSVLCVVPQGLWLQCLPGIHLSGK